MTQSRTRENKTEKLDFSVAVYCIVLRSVVAYCGLLCDTHQQEARFGYTHTQTHAHIHAHKYIHSHTLACRALRADSRECLDVYAYIKVQCVHACVRVCMHRCIHAYNSKHWP